MLSSLILSAPVPYQFELSLDCQDVGRGSTNHLYNITRTPLSFFLFAWGLKNLASAYYMGDFLLMIFVTPPIELSPDAVRACQGVRRTTLM